MSKFKNLSTLFRSATKSTTTKTLPPGDKTLKKYVSSLDTSSPPPPITQSTTTTTTTRKRLTKPPKPKKPNSKKPPPASPAGHSILPILKLDHSISDSDSASVNSPDSQKTGGDRSVENVLDIPWFSNLSHNKISLQRKEMSRVRKQKWIFRSTQVNRFHRLVGMCAQNLGTETTIEVLGKLGRETGVKEYNALIKICIDKSRTTNDEDVTLEQMSQAFRLFMSMKEQGFPIEEGTYGPFFVYLIDMCLVEEFYFFAKAIKEYNPNSVARLGYYEMLLYIRVDDEEKIQELVNCISTDYGGENINLRENYLLALCESDRKDDVLQLLETIDITKVSSLDHVATIFKSLGRLLLESLAEKFLLALKNKDYEAENISTLIFSYATSIPNLAVEDIVLKLKNLHALLEMTPSATLYEKLILCSCDLLKVHAALDVVDQMCEAGLPISIDTLNSILRASEESFEFNLVRRIYSLICHHGLKPNNETFRNMISLSVKMKDFGGAYGMLNDLKKLNLTPTASMYNAIMAGYFREKDISGALMVLKQMELAGVKPDSQTYSYLIGNCDSEEKIVKYYGELTDAGIQVTKILFMALINAYATCGQFEKAKQVLLDKGIPIKNFNEIKSVLVSALASHGQMSDALDIYEEIKEAGCNLEPKAIMSLIEHLQADGDLNRLLRLLEELHDPNYWVDGCCRIILYCVRNKHLSSAVNLLKQLKDRFCNDELVMEVLFDEVFSLIAEMEPPDLQSGLDLLQAIKNELDVYPSRKCLDFLLSICVKTKDLHNLLLIWKEYQAAGLPYNVLNYLRMYQALLACGDDKSAEILLSKIPKDDPHVCIMIQACKKTYEVTSGNGKTKKKKKNST